MKFWRYFQLDRMESPAGVGASTGFERQVVPVKGQPFAQVPVTMGTPIANLAVSQVEGTDFPFYTRGTEAKGPWPEVAFQKRRKAFQAGLMGTYNLGMPVPMVAAPPETTPILPIGKYIEDAVRAGKRRQRENSWATYAANQGALPVFPAIIPATTYSTTVCRILEEIQYHLLETPNEGASWGSGLWTVTEVVSYLNQRLARFYMETGVMQVHTTISGTAGQEKYDLPENWIDTRRVAWSQGGVVQELPRADAFTVDNWIPTWETVSSGRPSCYVEDPNASLQLRVARVPDTNGTIDLIGVQQHPTMTNDCSLLYLPDEWCSYVKWGVMADMLSKEGEANDPERATLCEARYGEGVKLARLLLGGPE